MSRAQTIADAVVAALTGTIAAVVTYRPEVDFVDQGPIPKAFVFPLASGSRRYSRGSFSHQVTLEIYIVRKVGKNDDSDIQAGLNAAESVIDKLEEDGIDGWTIDEIDGDPAIDPDLIDLANLFVSLVTVTYEDLTQ